MVKEWLYLRCFGCLNSQLNVFYMLMVCVYFWRLGIIESTYTITYGCGNKMRFFFIGFLHNFVVVIEEFIYMVSMWEDIVKMLMAGWFSNSWKYSLFLMKQILSCAKLDTSSIEETEVNQYSDRETDFEEVNC